MGPLVKDVWFVDDAIVSPLGFTSQENFDNLLKGITGVLPVMAGGIASILTNAGKISTLENNAALTRFEQMCVTCLTKLTQNRNLEKAKTLFVLSTTKGNVDQLQLEPSHNRIALHAAAQYIGQWFGFGNTLVVSNACVSGVMAITVASRYLRSGRYEHAIVLGADELTEFVASGFRSLGALSDELCRPFDRERKGINLGEAAAAVLLTVSPQNFSPSSHIRILGSGLSNDANHISGPSRTGEELAHAIEAALVESKIERSQIDFVSAHGTATMYNDEMEAKAFSLTGFSETPLHSLKGYYGHTLGAAGVLEIVIGIRSLMNNVLVPTLGFNDLGVSKALNVLKKPEKKIITTFLKTASGFGGCNAAMVIQKSD